MVRIVSQKLPPFRRRFDELAVPDGNPNKDRRTQVIGELFISRWREVLCGCGRGWCALCRCDRESTIEMVVLQLRPLHADSRNGRFCQPQISTYRFAIDSELARNRLL